MLRRGVEPLTMSQEKFRQLVTEEYERYGKLVKVAGIKIN
jgi:tripartite-type tricarboxylate transporter receptor subunit TctC